MTGLNGAKGRACAAGAGLCKNKPFGGLAENLLDMLDKYGLFILRHGEVEHWLPQLSVTRTKKWLHQIFTALGSDPKSPTYVLPRHDDVWAFLDKVAGWLKDKNRRGIQDPIAQTASADA